MGLMSAFFGNKQGHNGSGLMGLASSGYGEALNPDNPGWQGIHRSVPILQKPRGFSAHEAGALQAKAQQIEVQTANAKAAMKSLEKIESCDRDLHVSYRGYQAVVAQEHDKKLAANTEYAKALNPLREAKRQREVILEQYVAKTNGVLKGLDTWSQQTSGYFN